MPVGCRIEGIPSEATSDDLRAFLQALLTIGVSSGSSSNNDSDNNNNNNSNFSVVEWKVHRASCSATLLVPHRNVVTKVWKPLFRDTPLLGKHLTVSFCKVVPLALLGASGGGGDGSAENKGGDKNKNKTKKTAKKKKNTKTNSKSNGEPTNSSNNNDRPNAPENPRITKKRAQRIALAFYEYLQADASRLERAASRDATGVIFQDFYAQVYHDDDDDIDDNNDNDNDNKKDTNTLSPPRQRHHPRHWLIRLESVVMSQLRELRLLKSQRIAGVRANYVLMVYATTSAGVFPTSVERQSTQQRLAHAAELEQANKHGVTVSPAPEGVHTAREPDQDAFTLVVRYEREEKQKVEKDEDTPTPTTTTSVVQLESVTILGSHPKQFTVNQDPLPAPIPVSSSLHEEERSVPLTIQVSFTNPTKRIGVFRASIQFQFVKTSSAKPNEEEAPLRFVIVRPFAVKVSGNQELQDLLKPQSPYQRRAWFRSEKPIHVKNIVGPPPQPEGMCKKRTDAHGKEISSNPLDQLPQHNIPTDIESMLNNFELEPVLETLQPDESGERVQGYGTFWQHLLWASEFQNMKDMQLYDMEGVRLTRQGHQMVLQVPGLAEKRPSVFRGDLVHVKWQGKLYKGRVTQTRLLEVYLDFHPSFLQRYNPAVDFVDVRFTFSRTNYRTSHEAAVQAESSMMNMLYPNRQIADMVQSKSGDDHSSRRTMPTKWNFANPGLNEEQRLAVQKIVAGSARPLPYIIFGPPGTGKTTTVVEAVYQLAKHADQLKILLVAPSNDAADILVERLTSYFPPSEMRQIIAYSRTMESVPASIVKYTRQSFDVVEQKEEITSARIVVATVNCAARFAYYGIPSGHFDVLCVDEAGHATEPEVIAVAASSLLNFNRMDNRVGQLILAGDPKQLVPIVTSAVGRKFGLHVSYMERLMGRDVYSRGVDAAYPPDLLTKLVRNYRSHPAIIKLPNKMFYDDELQCCGDKLATHNMTNWEHLPCKGFPVLFHAMEGENLREARSPSWFNPQEAEQVVLYTQMLLNDTRPPLRPEEIGIITPYARQVQKIQLALKSQGIDEIKVGSVECFQGQERRCIIVSTVRSEIDEISTDLRFNLGFVANEKRFNVAITRAKTLLIVVGSPAVLSLDKENWLPFLKYCHENKSWVGDDWDPSAVAERTERGDSWDEQEREIMDGPSQAAEQEAGAFINREE